MNKEFVSKMIKAKKLEYEAIKSIMPSSIVDKIDEVEKKAVSFLEEILIEIVKEETSTRNEGKKVKKIGVDFN